MEYVIISIAVIVIMLYVVHAPVREKTKKTAQDVVGVCAVALERRSQKELRKSRVLELLAEHGDMGNEELRQHLGVSARSVVNYMNELESEGKVEQLGDIGQSVVYRIKT